MPEDIEPCPSCGIELVKDLEPQEGRWWASVIYEKGTEIEHYTVVCEIEHLKADNAKLRAMLKKLEWTPSDMYYCPICTAYAKVGHTDDCELAKLLEKP